MLMISKTADTDDFGQPIWRTVGEALYDAPTTHGPWALMTEASWKHHRRSASLGTGRGQKYAYDGENYMKVEG